MSVESADMVDPPQATEKLSLDLLHIIHDNHHRHGVREGSHLRYRNFCTSRLHSLRKTLNLTQATPNHKFKKRTLTTPDYKSKSALTIPLFTAERAWAQAMNLQSQDEVNVSPSLARNQIIRRLKAAVKASKELKQACTENCDTLSQTQADAYSAWLEGVLCLEKHDFVQALDQFTVAEQEYKTIANSKTSADLKSACEDKISQTQLYKTFCRNRIKIMIQDGSLDESVLENPNMKVSTTEVSQAETQPSSTQAGLFAQKYEKYDTLRNSIVQASEQGFKLSEKFLEEVIKTAKTRYPSTTSANIESFENDLQYFAVGCSSSLTTYLTMLASSRQVPTRGLNTSSYTSVKPSSLVTFFDRLLQNMDTLDEILPYQDMDDDDSTTFTNTSLKVLSSIRRNLANITCTALTAHTSVALRTAIYSAFRGIYIGFCYIFHQPSTTAAYVIMKECAVTFAELHEKLSQFNTSLHKYLESNEVQSDTTFIDPQTFDTELAQVSKFQSLIHVLLPRLEALTFIQERTTTSITLQSMDTLQISSANQTKTQAKLQTDTDSTLLDRLNIFSSGLESSQNIEKYRLLDFPPRFITTSVKPFLFDLSGSSLDYPSISHKLKEPIVPKQKEETSTQQNFWSKLFG